MYTHIRQGGKREGRRRGGGGASTAGECVCLVMEADDYHHELCTLGGDDCNHTHTHTHMQLHTMHAHVSRHTASVENREKILKFVATAKVGGAKSKEFSLNSSLSLNTCTCSREKAHLHTHRLAS